MKVPINEITSFEHWTAQAWSKQSNTPITDSVDIYFTLATVTAITSDFNL
jgi:hypothetical protein